MRYSIACLKSIGLSHPDALYRALASCIVHISYFFISQKLIIFDAIVKDVILLPVSLSGCTYLCQWHCCAVQQSVQSKCNKCFPTLIIYSERCTQAFLRAKAATAFSASQPSQFCPSVCLSHGWISQKRYKLGLRNLHHRLPGRLQFQEP